MAPQPFKIKIPQARLDRIRARLADAEWPDVPEGPAWAYGTSAAELRGLVDYFLARYDWRKEEAALNRFPQFQARVEDYDIHFVHIPGAGPNPKPMILSHGWPGSFTEFRKVIGPLTDPARHGGRAEDAFSVVVPSIPGYGFSSKPKRPISPRAVARLFDVLMRDLGYSNYIAQGGDWGAAISSWLGFEGAGCAAVHLNLVGVWMPPDVKPETPEELETLKRARTFRREEGAYMAIQGTKPLSLAYAMEDSPLGVMAWILEKWKGWSQLDNDDIWSVHSRDDVLTNIMIYLVTKSFGTASWLYNGVLTEPVPRGAKVTKPVGVANFAGEILHWPRSHVERRYNVVHWADIPKGGHFAAMEQPVRFVEELRAFGRIIEGKV